MSFSDRRFGARPPFAQFALAILSTFALVVSANAAFTWSTAYDQTSAVTNQLRAVEVSDQPGNNSVYVGMIQTSGGNRDVYQFNTTGSFPLAVQNDSGGSSDQPKAIATDDRGNVFVGDRISGGVSGKISIFSSTLTALGSTTTDVPNEQFGGLATAHFGGHYYLYASREATQANAGSAVGAQIRRYIVDTAATPVLDTTFGTAGVYTIPNTTTPLSTNTAKTLRGIEVAPDGTIYTTNRDTGTVYRISADLSSVISASLPRAMDVALFSGQVYVTSYNGTSSKIEVFAAADLTDLSTINITTLDGNPYTRGSAEGWGGIDIDQNTGRIWLGDENYNSSGTTKDRLLVSSALAAVPEPTTLLVMATIVLMGPLAVRKMKKLAA